jgi:hypothetical protein
MNIKTLSLILLFSPGISFSAEPASNNTPQQAPKTDRDLGLSTGKGRQDGIISISNARHLAGKYSTAPIISGVRPQRSQMSYGNPANRRRERFALDGFEWSIVNVRAFSELGSSYNPQHPTNGLFIVVELEVTNLSNKAKFIHSNLVLTANGRQYESSSKSVYAKDQMHYDDGRSVNIEPGVTHKTYYVFDAKQYSNYKLIMRGFLSEERAEKEINI